MAEPPPRWTAPELGFPPGRHFVVLPADPAAARQGLVLYDAATPRQRAILAAGRALLRLGWVRPLRLRERPPLPPPVWVAGWAADLERTLPRPVAWAAFRLLGPGDREPPRFTAVLLDRDRRPVAFAKVWRDGDDPEAGAARRALEVLAVTQGRQFEVPALLASATRAGRPYVVQEPLASPRHRAARPSAEELRAIVREIQERLGAGSPPAGGGPGQVPVHGSLTPANLRRGADGRLWLLDWDKAGWGPPGYDELRYWMAHLARSALGSFDRRADRLLALVGMDRTLVDIALRHRVAVRPTEVLASEQRLRDAVARRLSI